jgi:hypothetical protein
VRSARCDDHPRAGPGAALDPVDPHTEGAPHDGEGLGAVRVQVLADDRSAGTGVEVATSGALAEAGARRTTPRSPVTGFSMTG